MLIYPVSFYSHGLGKVAWALRDGKGNHIKLSIERTVYIEKKSTKAKLFFQSNNTCQKNSSLLESYITFNIRIQNIL